jgi:hypothetical protein
VSKASAILICPTVALRSLPDRDRDVLRTFFTEHVRGMDRKHDTRWRRFVRDLFNAEPGEGFQLYRAEQRGGPYHKRHRAILTRLYESQERFRHIDKLHDWLKVGAGFVTWEPGTDSKPVAIPRSTAFEVCSEDEMREAHVAMVDFLRTDFATRRLWPHLKAPMRHEMLESVLANPNETDAAR